MQVWIDGENDSTKHVVCDEQPVRLADGERKYAIAHLAGMHDRERPPRFASPRPFRLPRGDFEDGFGKPGRIPGAKAVEGLSAVSAEHGRSIGRREIGRGADSPEDVLESLNGERLTETTQREKGRHAQSGLVAAWSALECLESAPKDLARARLVDITEGFQKGRIVARSAVHGVQNQAPVLSAAESSEADRCVEEKRTLLVASIPDAIPVVGIENAAYLLRERRSKSRILRCSEEPRGRMPSQALRILEATSLDLQANRITENGQPFRGAPPNGLIRVTNELDKDRLSLEHVAVHQLID